LFDRFDLELLRFELLCHAQFLALEGVEAGLEFLNFGFFGVFEQFELHFVFFVALFEQLGHTDCGLCSSLVVGDGSEERLSFDIEPAEILLGAGIDEHVPAEDGLSEGLFVVGGRLHELAEVVVGVVEGVEGGSFDELVVGDVPIIADLADGFLVFDGRRELLLGLWGLLFGVGYWAQLDS
jgi:hypothetical protein